MNIPERYAGQFDEMYDEAKKIVVEEQKAMASLLQRKLKIGYAAAVYLLELLEERGVIGPANGAKPREVLTPNQPPN